MPQLQNKQQIPCEKPVISTRIKQPITILRQVVNNLFHEVTQII